MEEISEIGGLQRFAPAENIGVTEYPSQWILEAIRRNLVELLGPEDANAYGYGLAKYVGDDIGVENVNAQLVGRGRTRADNVGVTDARVRKLWKYLQFVESLGVVDESVRRAGNFRPLYESVNVSDTQLTTLAYIRYLMDSLGVTDQYMRVGYEYYFLTESVLTTDMLAIKKTMNRILADTIGPTDSARASRVIRRICADIFRSRKATSTFDYQDNDVEEYDFPQVPNPPWVPYYSGYTNYITYVYKYGFRGAQWLGYGGSYGNACNRHTGMDGKTNGYFQICPGYAGNTDFYIFARAGTISSGKPQTGVYFKFNADSPDSTYSTGYITAGVMTEIDTKTGPFLQTDLLMRIECVGNEITCWLSHTLMFSWTDTYSGRTSGYYGFGSYAPDSTMLLRNYEGGEVWSGLQDYVYSTEEPLVIRYLAEMFGIDDRMFVNGELVVEPEYFGPVTLSGERLPYTNTLYSGGVTMTWNLTPTQRWYCPGTGLKSIEQFQLWCYGDGPAPGYVRLGLYDTDGNLVCQWSAAIEVTGGVMRWVGETRDTLLGTTTITGGQEYIIAIAKYGDVATEIIELANCSGEITGTDYRGGMPSTLPSSSFYEDYIHFFRVGVYDAEGVAHYKGDSVGLSDGIKTLHEYVRALQEQLGLTDHASSWVSPTHYRMSVADAIFTLLIGVEQSSIYAEDIGVADALNLKIILEQFISGDVGLEDVLMYLRGMAGQGADSQEVSDSLTYRRDFGRPVADTINVTDITRRTLQYIRAMTSLLGIPDNVLLGYLLYFKVSDLGGVTDGGGMGGSEGGGSPPPGGGFGSIDPAMEILQ